jgi:hypothetical protein
MARSARLARVSGSLLALAAGAIVTGVVTAGAGRRSPINHVVQHDFGTVTPGAAIEHTFEIENNDAAAMTITAVNSSCGCVPARLSSRTIPPGGAAELNLTLAALRPGESSSQTVWVHAERDDDPLLITLHLSAAAAPSDDYHVEPPIADQNSDGATDQPQDAPHPSAADLVLKWRKADDLRAECVAHIFAWADDASGEAEQPPPLLLREITEEEFVALPAADRDAISSELITSGRAILNIGLHIVSEGDSNRNNAQLQEAERHYRAAALLGRVHGDPTRTTNVVRMMMRHVERRATGGLVALYQAVDWADAPEKLEAARKRLQELESQRR